MSFLNEIKFIKSIRDTELEKEIAHENELRAERAKAERERLQQRLPKIIDNIKDSIIELVINGKKEYVNFFDDDTDEYRLMSEINTYFKNEGLKSDVKYLSGESGCATEGTFREYNTCKLTLRW